MKTETVIRYGSAARGNRGAYTGTKVHRLVCDLIVELTPAELAAARRGSISYQYKLDLERGLEREHFMRVRPSCGVTSGQWAGLVEPGFSAANVTCKKCLEVLAVVNGVSGAVSVAAALRWFAAGFVFKTLFMGGFL